MKPACVKCQRFFQVKKNGFIVCEAMPKTILTPPGTAYPEGWMPYKLWRADLWECLGCGTEIVSGWGRMPSSERYMQGFDEALKLAEVQINDC